MAELQSNGLTEEPVDTTAQQQPVQDYPIEPPSHVSEGEGGQEADGFTTTETQDHEPKGMYCTCTATVL